MSRTAEQAPPAPDLRERRRLATRQEIYDVALGLFERQGVAATTVDEIAQAAGVSPRTFFRYFASKEEAVLAPARDLDEALALWVLEADAEADLLPEIERAFVEVIVGPVAGTPDAIDHMVRIRRLVAAEPALRAAALALDGEITARLASRVAEQVPSLDAVSARLVAEVAQATMRVAFDEWADRGGDVDLADVYRQVRAALRRVVVAR
ncbi:TetR family transcriptional regulator [Solicola sp. PLA-1-18]|uniref:TetR family transcriptional regulator n=1 Tax=Solicola sp. PLA-1-18 TaxID=3380532 RepID=UPI003B79B851